MRTPGTRLSILLAAILLMAGCGAKSQPEDANPQTTDHDTLPEGVSNILEGVVQGPDYLPLSNATVRVNGLEDNATTDDSGYYRFESLTPRDYILTANREGYRPKSQRAIIEDDKIFKLDFVLEEIPLEAPYNRTLDGGGQISCQAAYQTAPDNTARPNCGRGVDPGNKQDLYFDVQPGAAQIQVELVWEETTTAAKRLTISVESMGDNSVQFAHDMGESPLKTLVSQSLLKTNMPEGGRIHVLVESAVGVTGDESATDVGLAFQQGFHVWFTIFYIEPGPPNFTAL